MGYPGSDYKLKKCISRNVMKMEREEEIKKLQEKVEKLKKQKN